MTRVKLYPGEVLFKIEVNGSELTITRCEHYVDDVNSFTVESILNDRSRIFQINRELTL